MDLRVSRQHSIPLICTALFALLWVITRACVQTITIDEAETYLAFVRPPWPAHWVAASNNHVLNTLLIKLFTSIFGPYHLALRAPALVGAAIYIYACYFLCRLMTAQMRVQWPLLVCLIYNPFVLDYLVAARGYSLSTAFLMCTLVITAASQWKAMTEREPPLIRPIVYASACAALSFAANF